MSVFAWALTYIGAATVSYLFMRLLDKLDRPGKVKLIGRKDDAGRAESGGATGMRSVMQYSEPERPLEPKDYDLPVCPVCGEETDTYYKNKDGVIVGCEFCIDAVDAWEEKE